MKRLFAFFFLVAIIFTGCSETSGESPVPDTAQDAAAASSSVGNTSGVESSTYEPDSEPSDDHIVKISEKLFIAQTNDIYINPDDYLGKTIQYEGIYKKSVWEEFDKAEEIEIHYVIRYGPGCCGYDGEAGFEVSWDGEWPQEDAWVEVIGVLSKIEFDGGSYYLVLELNSLTVKDERGAEYVST